MKMTTKDIIQVLPFGKEFQKELLEGFDTLTPDQKFNIEQIVWDAYGAIYRIRLDKNTREALMLAEDGKEALDKKFYDRVREKTDKEMQTKMVQAETTVDLSEAREALQDIIKGTTTSGSN